MLTKERLKELRSHLKISQAELSRRLGASASLVGVWESGAQPIPTLRAQQISRIFNVSMDWLETGRGPMFADFPLNHDALLIAAGGEIFRRFSPELQSICLEFLKRLIENGGDIVDAMAVFPDSMFFPSGLLNKIREREKEQGGAPSIGIVKNNSGTVTQNINIEK